MTEPKAFVPHCWHDDTLYTHQCCWCNARETRTDTIHQHHGAYDVAPMGPFPDATPCPRKPLGGKAL